MGRIEASRGEAGRAQRPLPKARRPLPPLLLWRQSRNWMAIPEKMAQHSHTTWKTSKPRTSSCLTLTPPSPMLLAELPSGFGFELCLPPDASQRLAVLELVLATCA